MVTKGYGNEVFDKEESGANDKAATAGFEHSVVRTTGNMSERGGDQFGRVEGALGANRTRRRKNGL